MASDTSNSASIKQSVYNDFYSLNENSCFAQSSITQSGNVINIDGTVGGDVGIVASGTVDQICLINQQINQSITDILTAQAQQTNTTVSDLMNDLNAFDGEQNSVQFQQSIYNNMTQISSNTCSANNTIVQDNNIINVGTTGIVGGDVLLQATSNVSNNCTLNNLVNQTAFNNLQAKSDQTNVELGMMSLVIIAVVVLVIVGAIVLVILHSRGGFGAVVSGGEKGEGGEAGLESLEAGLLKEELGS